MDERIKKIANYYGYEPQSRQLIEEMAELTVAINKYWRFQRETKASNKLTLDDLKKNDFLLDNITEEIADVEIMLEQIKCLTACGLRLKGVKEQKIERQIMRIEREVKCHE